MVSVVANGNIVPCNQLSGKLEQDGICMGNVHKDGLRALLSQSDYLDRVTCTVGELKEQNPKCQKCDFFKLCLGGCRACAYVLNGNIMGYDPIKCLYFEGGYIEKTQKLFEGSGFICVDEIYSSLN